MPEFKPENRPVVLCIMDGWGIGDGGEYDAIAQADTPNYDKMRSLYPNATLTTGGLAVGLPEGQMGNSEVGHMNIGAGRVVMQFLPRISKAFANDEVKDYKPLRDIVNLLQSNGRACHVMGLLSDGGVHSHIDHIVELGKIVAAEGIETHIHAFTDGRDCPPESGKGFVARALLDIDGHENISLSTISGRYYAMDRDNRWERVEKAYNALVLGKGREVISGGAIAFMEENYDAGITDEFIEPGIIGGYRGIKPGDAIIFANFRNDRAREILQAMLFESFEGFERAGGKPEISKAVAMVEYSDELVHLMDTLFLPLEHNNLFGEIIANHGLRQMRMAETEKYPHVTFFFNCGRENPYEGEDRVMIPSPKVATYDLKPQMSVFEVSEKLQKVIAEDKHDVVIVNFANADMVGHTGSLEAAKEAVESVDKALGELEPLVIEKGGILLVTADHGNADQMFDENTGGPHTAHTLNPVPFIVAGAPQGVCVMNGKLADIAPTMLYFLGIEKPEEMDGANLVFYSE